MVSGDPEHVGEVFVGGTQQAELVGDGPGGGVGSRSAARFAMVDTPWISVDRDRPQDCARLIKRRSRVIDLPSMTCQLGSRWRAFGPMIKVTAGAISAAVSNSVPSTEVIAMTERAVVIASERLVVWRGLPGPIARKAPRE